jgi:hypothetical protein
MSKLYLLLENLAYRTSDKYTFISLPENFDDKINLLKDIYSNSTLVIVSKPEEYFENRLTNSGCSIELCKISPIHHMILKTEFLNFGIVI